MCKFSMPLVFLAALVLPGHGHAQSTKAPTKATIVVKTTLPPVNVARAALLAPAKAPTSAPAVASGPQAAPAASSTLPAVLAAPAASQPVVIAPLKGPDDAAGAGNVVIKATRSSNWRLAVISGLLLIVIFLRKFGAKFWPWCASDRGGAILSLAAGLLVVVINSLITGKGFDPQLLIDGLMTGTATSGVYSVAKKIGWPSDLPATKAGPEAPPPKPTVPDEVPVTPPPA